MDKYGLCELLQLQTAITNMVRDKVLHGDTLLEAEYARSVINAWDTVYPRLREIAYPVKVKGLRETARNGENYGEDYVDYGPPGQRGK